MAAEEDTWWGKRESWLDRVATNGFELVNAPSELQGDREVVLAAVSQCGYVLRYATEELQGDYEIVRTAIEQDWRALRSASDKMQASRDIVLMAVMQDWRALDCAAESLLDDRDVVLHAVKQNCLALEKASPSLGVELARNADIIKKHLSANRVLIISMLSGRSCAVIISPGGGETKRDILERCSERLGAEFHKHVDKRPALRVRSFCSMVAGAIFAGLCMA
eukprot:CAMPEP_0178415884 /NCGR_PEP_ID=MMETSP0689_2-20121128/23779_1 /TAXON_ID=160604 /ORGANISM="Amphidinium massartii, Strain CS-259" /LENGTH=221 /DNA_ID=CAMNT_0020037213 /DNA_START=42 /DNA_END=704 /DNA_ORIENTATION=-